MTAPAAGGGTATTYLQMAVANRRGGARDALGAGGSSAASMAGAGSPQLLDGLQARMSGDGLMAKLSSRLGPWTTSMLYAGPAGTLAPCHWDALDNVFVQVARPPSPSSPTPYAQNGAL